MEPEQIIEVLSKMETLAPDLILKYTQEQLYTYISMAYAFIEVSELDIPEDRIVLITAVKTLALLAVPENSSLSSKKIKDVEITYYQGQGKSKWDSLFDSIVSGGDSEFTLRYIGI